VPEAEPLDLQLGILTRADYDRIEVIDEVAGPLQLSGAGARRPLGGCDGIHGSAPRLERGGSCCSRAGAFLPAEGV
jgi:hypothetical protein